MKKLLLILFFIIVSNSPSYSLDILCKVIGFTCSKVNYENLIRKDGYYYEKFKNEKYLGYVFGIKSGFVKNGKREGTWEIYFKSGELRRKINYKNGFREGVSEEYFRNGILKNKSTYKNGKVNGIYNKYYTNGQLKYWTEYKDGIRNGEYEKFYNDTLIVKGNYQNDKRNGLWSYTDQFGKVTTKTWEYGILKSGWYDRNGTKGQLENFKKEGYWREFVKYGLSEGNYKNDKRVGFWIVRDWDTSKGEYKNGFKQGKWKTYNLFGELVSEVNYENGKKIGKELSFFKNGKIKKIINYKNNIKEGIYEIFMKNGVKCESGTYKNNVKKTEFKLTSSYEVPFKFYCN